MEFDMISKSFLEDFSMTFAKQRFYDFCNRYCAIGAMMYFCCYFQLFELFVILEA